MLRVWQNHGLQLDRVPEGFSLLATSYLCRNQMMVKKDEGQLIYTVQFHLEKSFEDWNKSRTRWEHQNESRDGRVLFENFLKLASGAPATAIVISACNFCYRSTKSNLDLDQLPEGVNGSWRKTP